MKTPHIASLPHRHVSTAIALVLFCAFSANSRAGSMVSPAPDSLGARPFDDGKETKETVTPPPPENPWHFDIAIVGWLADTAGTMGLKGVNSHIYVPMDYVIRHLDMTAAFNAEVRYNRWGVYGDFLYVKASDAEFPNNLVAKADVGIDEWIADLEINYRLLQGPRGYLDVRAGVRYTDLHDKLVLNANNKAMNQAAEDFANDAAAKIKDIVSGLNFQTRLGTVLSNLIRSRIVNKISGLQANRPNLPIAPLAAIGVSRSVLSAARRAGFDTSGQNAVLAPLELAVHNAVEKDVHALETALRDELTAATAALKAAAQSRVNSLKQKIANEVASAIRDKINTSVTLNERWLDPYVGIAFRYDLDRVFYLTGKTDIGGFGIGSEITWQAYIGLGCQITRSIYAEAGYRYLYTDYTRASFLYDITQSGVQFVVGMKF
jgi:hypothetical protein